MTDYKIPHIFTVPEVMEDDLPEEFEQLTYEIALDMRAYFQKQFEQWVKDNCVKVGGFGSQWCTSANKYDTHLSLLLPPQEIK